MEMRRSIAAATCALLAAVITAAEPPRERIVYTSLRPANWELFLVDHGKPLRALTDDPALDYDPRFSPDGKWVVFCSERSGNPDLYAVDVDLGGAPKPLTRSVFMEAAPAFSPDGRSKQPNQTVRTGFYGVVLGSGGAPNQPVFEPCRTP